MDLFIDICDQFLFYTGSLIFSTQKCVFSAKGVGNATASYIGAKGRNGIGMFS